MEEYKFRTIQERVLFNIVRARKKVTRDEIVSLAGGSVTKKQVNESLTHLKRRNLIRSQKIEYSSAREYFINKSQIKRIKNIIGDHWESNWETEWIKVLEVKNGITH